MAPHTSRSSPRNGRPPSPWGRRFPRGGQRRPRPSPADPSWLRNFNTPTHRRVSGLHRAWTVRTRSTEPNTSLVEVLDARGTRIRCSRTLSTLLSTLQFNQATLPRVMERESGEVGYRVEEGEAAVTERELRSVNSPDGAGEVVTRRSQRGPRCRRGFDGSQHARGAEGCSSVRLRAMSRMKPLRKR